MNFFFSVCFRTSRAIPGEIPGQAYGNFPSPLRKGLRNFPESTPVLPEKNCGTLRRGLETDQEGKIYFIPQRRYLLSPEKIYFSRH